MYQRSSAHERLKRTIIIRPVTIPKINMLNIDVFTLILQEVINEEVNAYMDYYERPTDEPKAAVTLALVCKRWRDVVYLTPSFWPIITLSMDSSTGKMQAKVNILASRAMNAPVDLHILSVHSDDFHRFSWPDHSDDCCCKAGSTKFRLDLSGLSNVRSLRIEFTHEDAFFFLEPSGLPSLQHLKVAEFFLSPPDTELAQRLDFNRFLHYAPNIVELRLSPVEAHNLSWALPNNALMPTLRSLNVAPGLWTRWHSNKLPHLAKILSHAPNLEALKMIYFDNRTKIPIPAQFWNSIKCFSKLRIIDTDVVAPLIWLFSDSGVSTPNLEQLCYNDRDLHVYENDMRKFLSAHQSIKVISLSICDDSPYHQRLSWMPNIEELTISGTSDEGKWLTPLCTPNIIDEITGLTAYLCPNLRVMTVIDLDDLVPSSFEELVRVRCLPVDENGYTAAGCRAIEVLVMQLSVNKDKYASFSATKAWRKAEVRNIGNNRYELRWPYRPDETSVPDTLIPSISRSLSTLKLV